ncbi:HIT family protein [bacterium]|nr:HIT family protein [bacterium]MBU1991181.1 HIT family protein [bacterium]
MNKSCVFCSKNTNIDIIDCNNLALAFYDLYPVTKYHTLIVPKRHVANYFELEKSEIDAINELIYLQKDQLLKIDKTITGFNIGVNIGEDAGQSIFHTHIHLIPRRKGDTEKPKGGVRGVIPEKQKY